MTVENICDLTDDCLYFVSQDNRLRAPFYCASDTLSCCRRDVRMSREYVCYYLFMWAERPMILSFFMLMFM